MEFATKVVSFWPTKWKNDEQWSKKQFIREINLTYNQLNEADSKEENGKNPIHFLIFLQQ